eukprot:6150736-Prymnesium_polylepis.1
MNGHMRGRQRDTLKPHCTLSPISHVPGMQSTTPLHAVLTFRTAVSSSSRSTCRHVDHRRKSFAPKTCQAQHFSFTQRHDQKSECPTKLV